jgi:hypothetical protein
LGCAENLNIQLKRVACAVLMVTYPSRAWFDQTSEAPMFLSAKPPRMNELSKSLASDVISRQTGAYR